uniref:Uncharacterized protein n=1 Tax=Florenciella parvula TaxID=236787 RepID=A0A7S2BLG5_9STRA
MRTMTVKASKSSPAAVRRSSRAKGAPARFRPGGDANVPSDVAQMIHDAAAAAAAKSVVPFEPSAVTALEEALEPMLEALAEAAAARAESKGRENFDEDDLKAVCKTFMKNC